MTEKETDDGKKQQRLLGGKGQSEDHRGAGRGPHHHGHNNDSGKDRDGEVHRSANDDHKSKRFKKQNNQTRVRVGSV